MRHPISPLLLLLATLAALLGSRTEACAQTPGGNDTASAVALPYCVAFSADDSLLPAGWTLAMDSADHAPLADPDSGALRLATEDGRWLYLIAPAVQADTSLSAWLDAAAQQASCLQLGVLASGTDTSTFLPLAECSGFDGQWQTLTADLRPYRHLRVALRARGTALVRNLALQPMPVARYSQPDARTLVIRTEHGGNFLLSATSVGSSCPEVDTLLSVTDSLTLQLPPCPDTALQPLRLRLVQQVAPGESQCQVGLTLDLSYRHPAPYCHVVAAGDEADSLPAGWRAYPPAGPGAPHIVTSADGDAVALDASQWQCVVLPEVAVDSLPIASISLAARSLTGSDSLVVGLMTDAFDTASFRGFDTLALPNAWQTLYPAPAPSEGGARWLALRPLHRADGGQILIGRVGIENCRKAQGAVATLHAPGTVRIGHVDSLAAGGFYAEYGPQGFAEGQGTVLRIDSLPLMVSIDGGEDLDFYFRCDSAAYGCGAPQTVAASCLPLALPVCIDFDTLAPEAPARCWASLDGQATVAGLRAHSGSQSLQLPTHRQYVPVGLPFIEADSISGVTASLWLYAEAEGDRLVVGTLEAPDEPATFRPLHTLVPAATGQWQRFSVGLSDAPAGSQMLAVCAIGGEESSHVYLDDLHLSACGTAALRVVEASPDHVTLDWEQTGSPDVTLTLMQGGYTSRILSGIGEPPLTVNSLLSLHRYTFILKASCPDDTTTCATEYIDTVVVVTPDGGAGCIDFANMGSPQASYFAGTCGHPLADEGAVDYGYASPDSRHTLHYDTAERDPRTGGMLRTVPAGATASMRLGNWATHPAAAQAASAVYGLWVDTMDFDLLLLRYAAVMQEGAPGDTSHPRFQMELLDSLMQPLGDGCASATLMPGTGAGWDTTEAHTVWHNWNAVGVDLAPYAGQQVFLRLTAADGADGSRFGYAYFTLECMRRQIAVSYCGTSDEAVFTAPEGFAYQWSIFGDTTVLSTDQSFATASTDTSYTCRIAFRFNPECHFSLNAYAGARYPMARMDTTSALYDCGLHVSFHNRSTLSADGIHPLDSGEPCESAHWDFGNGQTADTYHATATYREPGTYTVTLVVSTGRGQCSDTLRRTLNLDIPTGVHYDTVAACEAYTWQGHIYYASGQYTDTLPVANAIGCDSTLVLTLTISHPDTTLVTDTVSHSQLPYTYLGMSFDSPVDTLIPIEQPNGCTDRVRLILHTTDRQTRHICDSQLPYTWNGVRFTQTDSATVSVAASTGGTQIITMLVFVHPTYDLADTIVVCPGQAYEYEGVDYGGPTSFQSMHLTTYDCDSLVRVALVPRPLSLQPAPIFSFDSVQWFSDSIIVGCAPATLHLRDTTRTAYRWQWTLSTPDTTLQDTTQQFAYCFARGYDQAHSTATLIVNSGRGCTDTIQRSVYLFRKPIADFIWDPAVIPMHDPQIQFFNRTAPDSLAYLWQIQRMEGGEYDTSSAVDPHYYWGQPGDDMTGEYTVNLIAYWTHTLDSVTHTCTDTASHTIVITNDNLLFPNLVTPNGDGKNDVWRIHNLIEYGNYPINELSIYNAWGALVFHKRNIRSEEQFWDPDATSCPDGTYFYRFTAVGEYGSVKRNGVIEVIRD